MECVAIAACAGRRASRRYLSFRKVDIVDGGRGIVKREIRAGVSPTEFRPRCQSRQSWEYRATYFSNSRAGDVNGAIGIQLGGLNGKACAEGVGLGCLFWKAWAGQRVRVVRDR